MWCGRRILLAGYILVIVALLFTSICVPTTSKATSGTSAPADPNAPLTVQIGVYVLDFNDFSVEAGTFQATFYLDIISGANVSINDLELMNGEITSVDATLNTATEREYRVTAMLSFEPDFHRYPFDRHTLSIQIEPKLMNETEMILAISPEQTGLDSEANLPGWEISGISSSITDKTYLAGEAPYSRAVFSCTAQRDSASTVLKFFIPILLIIVVALCSLMIKISSRLGLNASMFLAAVLIHWRMADSIPNVAYATFLDEFMIIAYATLVMVLISGLLSLKYAEVKEMEKVNKVNKWSIRIIPPISIALCALLFLSLLF